MKKFVRVLLGIFFSILIIIVLLGLFVGLFILDNRGVTEQDVIDNPKTTEIILNDSIAEGIDNIDSNNKVSVYIDSNDLNHILHTTLEGIELQVDKFSINGMAINYNKDKYVLQAAVQYSAFKSVITAGITCKQTESELSFEISEVKLGKVGFTKLAKKVLSNIDSTSIENQLNTKGLKFNVDLANLNVSISKDSLNSLIRSSIVNDTNNPLYEMMFDVVLDNKDSMSYLFGNDGKIGVNLDLPSSTSISNLYNYNFTKIADNVKYLIDNKLVKYEDAHVCFNFIVNGYDYLSDNEKVIIDKYNLSNIDIYNNKEYKGIMKNYPNMDIDSYLESKISSSDDIYSSLSNGSYVINIEENALNQILTNTELLGTCYTFTHSETNKVSYIIFEQINMQCEKDSINTNLVINIGGNKIMLSLDLSSVSSSSSLITTSITNISLGDVVLDDNQQKQLIDYIAANATHIDFIKFDSTNKTISLDFTSALNSNDEIIKLKDKCEQLGYELVVSTTINKDNIELKYEIQTLASN